MSYSVHVGTNPASLTDLSGASYGLTVLRHSPMWLPAVQGRGSDLPGVDGGYSDGLSFRAREMQVRCLVKGATASALRTQMDAVLAQINGTLGDIWWKFDQFSDRMWAGRVWDIVQGRRSVNWTEFDLVIRCADALAYSTTETSQTLAVTTSPQTLTIPASGSVAGSAAALPEWIIKNTGLFPSGAITLSSTTTGESISLDGLATGDWYKLIRGRQLVQISSDSGANWTTSMSDVTTSTQIPTLKNGVSNSLSITGLGSPTSGSVVVTYRARYL